jgi:hypothetical protein
MPSDLARLTNTPFLSCPLVLVHRFTTSHLHRKSSVEQQAWRRRSSGRQTSKATYGKSSCHFSLPAENWLIFVDTRPGLPKRFQSFLFFQIQKPDLFKSRLKQFASDNRITTASQACEMKDVIAGAQRLYKSSGRRAPLLPLPGVNIAFSSSGLHKVGELTISGCPTLTLPFCM